MGSDHLDLRPVKADLDKLQPKLQTLVLDALSRMAEKKIIQRIRNHDHTVWKPDPTDIANRLGWLTIPQKMMGSVEEISALVDEVRHEGFTHALLMGMGGSSLAPEVFRMTFGVKKGYLDLAVLDSTDPRAVGAAAQHLNPSKTLHIVSTKSGGTVETLSFLKYFYNKTVAAVGAEKAGAQFIAITDPGSRLEALGRDLAFRKIFLNDPEIGGRYSALSYFGLVPAALVGVNLKTLLDRAVSMATSDGEAGLHLGALMGELAIAGKDKLTLILSSGITSLGSWIEQLVAESTGKEGKGILPVDGEALLSPDAYGKDRLFVYLRLKGDTLHDVHVDNLKMAGHPVVTIELNDEFDLGGEFYRWEMATAVAGHRMGINPFDQPNVESAKVSARKMLATYQETGQLPKLDFDRSEDGLAVVTSIVADTIEAIFHQFLGRARKISDHSLLPYVAIQAYLPPSADTDKALFKLRSQIQSH